MIKQGTLRQALTRRRFVSVLAAAAVAPLASSRGLAERVETFDWEGIALGAHARLCLQHPDEDAAKSAIAACLEEVARLETIFSLHRSDSSLARLNACGRLDAAPADLRLLSGGGSDACRAQRRGLRSHHPTALGTLRTAFLEFLAPTRKAHRAQRSKKQRRSSAGARSRSMVLRSAFASPVWP